MNAGGLMFCNGLALNRCARTGVATAVILAATACATPDEHAGFAQAGSAYVAKTEAVIDRLATEKIDLNSRQFLADDAGSPADSTLAAYRSSTEPITTFLALAERIRKHQAALGAYFVQLDRLASGQSHRAVAQSAVGAAEAVATLRPDTLTVSPQIAAAFTAIIVDARLASDLKEELRLRAPLVKSELALQRSLLAELRLQALRTEQAARAQAENRLIIAPLVAPKPITNEDGWVSARREWLLSKRRIDELDDAQAALTALEDAYDSLSDPKLTADRVAHAWQVVERIAP